MMHPDAVCRERAIIHVWFRYVYRHESLYWTYQVCWELHRLSSLARFVPYNMFYCYNLRETARDRMLVHIAPKFARLDVFQDFSFEQEPIFS